MSLSIIYLLLLLLDVGITATGDRAVYLPRASGDGQGWVTEINEASRSGPSGHAESLVAHLAVGVFWSRSQKWPQAGPGDLQPPLRPTGFPQGRGCRWAKPCPDTHPRSLRPAAPAWPRGPGAGLSVLPSPRHEEQGRGRKGATW